MKRQPHEATMRTQLRDLIQSGQSPEAHAQQVVTYSAQEQATKVTNLHVKFIHTMKKARTENTKFRKRNRQG